MAPTGLLRAQNPPAHLVRGYDPQDVRLGNLQIELVLTVPLPVMTPVAERLPVPTASMH